MRDKMTELVDKLNEYARAYYTFDAPKISDSEYDALFDELVALERETGIVLDDSPTRRVGSELAPSFLPHTHIARLWSLDKVRTKEELFEWARRLEKLVAEYEARSGEKLPKLSYALEYKFDGLTINLTYENGKLTQGATRGNGIVGEAILAQIKTIRSIPLTIPFTGRMEVQGEGYMRLSVLEKLNEKGGEQLKNARNAAAGALRNLNLQITAERRLDCVCYNIGFIEGMALSSHDGMLSFLKRNGLPVSDYFKIFDDIRDVFGEIEKAEKTRGALDFLIDGMVIKVRDFQTREILGSTDRFPRWAMAYKFAAEETTTTVRDVTWEVGRTGKLTPRAHLLPVELSGATISHATLNNWDDICRKRVGIGSKVFIRRSGDVIPEILSAVPGDAPECPVEKPVKCPACGAHVEHRGVHVYCTNSLSCRPQIVARITHFASRGAMDIETLSEKTAAQLVEKLGVSSIPMLSRLDMESLLTLDGFAKQKAQNLLDAIERSKTRPLGEFIFAIGIPNVGAKTANDLARKFGSMEALRRAAMDELIQIKDVGGIVAQSIVDFFGDETTNEQIDKLLALGVSPTEEMKIKESPITGKTLVVTGTMERMDRKAIEELIESLGGRAAQSVSQKTDYVIAGDGAGSKLTKALELQVPVLTEKEFFDMIGENG